MTIEVIAFSVAVIVLVSYFFWFVFDYHDKNLKDSDPIVIQLDNGGNFVSREIKPTLGTLNSFTEESEYLFISRGFSWNRTREGIDYWRNIAIKWNQCLEKNK